MMIIKAVLIAAMRLHALAHPEYQPGDPLNPCVGTYCPKETKR